MVMRWGLKSFQARLDYFTGSTTILNVPSPGSNRQDSLSPGSRSNCCTSQRGTVVLSDDEFVVARANTVSVPAMSEDISEKVYKITYPITKTFINVDTYIGNGIGNKVVSMQIHNPRQLKALAILSSGIDAIKRIDPNHYRVMSQHGNGYYDVTYKRGDGWQCTCPAFQDHEHDCKHIYAAHFSSKLRLDAEREVETNTLHVQELVNCPECKGYDVKKDGKRKCKKGVAQRYKCRACGHRFVPDRSLSRLKATQEAVCVAMDLYFKGNSLAKIKHHLKMFYKVNVDRSTIMRWMHKFSKVLNQYSEKHKPQVGDVWNCDEMTINVRKEGVKHNLEWIWNLMDSDTRYMLASTVTHARKVKDAKKVLNQGKKRAGTKPKVLITDSLHSYNEANRKAFYSNRDPTIHFRTPPERKHFLNQNIERANGTYRERLKVMRGVHSIPTAQTVVDGERFYYNHIRPSMSLNGMTPAQVAGVPTPDIEKENPWLAYLLAATREETPA